VLNGPIQLIGPASPFGNSRETFGKSGTDGLNPVPSSSESFANLTSSWRSPTWEHSAIRVSERRRKDRDRSASPQRSRTALGLGIPSWNIRSSARRHSADRRKPGAGSPSRPPASSPLSRLRLPNKGVVPFLHASARLGRDRRIGCSGVHLIPQQGLTGVVAIPIQRAATPLARGVQD
jgi:hypothetical protein